MTCTTHHICDCLLRKMEKLEAVAEAAMDALDDIDPMFRTTVRLKEALAELVQP